LAGMAAMMLASCSSDKLGPDPTPSQPTLEAGAVGFDAYTQRGTTRAGVPGDLTDADFKNSATDLGKAGFGVFAYYTDLNEYDQLYTPNFFYNQQVKYNTTSTKWEYTPVKYWPNEYGSSALSDDVDKVSFFAYAPYVDVAATSGKVDADKNTWGIAGLSKNSATGDPVVKYIASFDPLYTVDLCWGVANGEVWNKTNGGSQTMKAGLPWIDVERPLSTDVATGSLKFTFLHALSQLQVKVDAAVDALDPGTALEGDTKIYVRSISFTGVAQKGALNLNNTQSGKALWLNYNGTDELESGDVMTLYDGLKDGKEGTGQAASNEKLLGFNPNIISNLGNTTPGVTETAVDLFANSTAFVIPSGETMTVTITYDVETPDNNLAGYLSDGVTHGSSIQNVISKEVHFGSNDYLENGKKYVLNLHLGMNSVKFDAEVTAWDPTAIERDVELPFNAVSFASGTNATLNLAATATAAEAVFYVTGLDKSATPMATFDTGSLLTLTAATLDDTQRASRGYVKVTPTGLIANTTTSKRTGSITVTDAAGAVSVITINQVAHELGLTNPPTFDGTDKFTFAPTATDVTDLAAAGITVVVKKDGTDLALTTDYIISGLDIQLVTAAAPTEVYTFTITANDAPAETVTITIP
ncbi:MAG: hypothetical protein IJ612_00635, partial [Prevotella sp.]|nr:hypothetical protein [Prevotella sp.]